LTLRKTVRKKARPLKRGEGSGFQESFDSIPQKLGKIESIERNSGRLNLLDKKLGKKEKYTKEGIALLSKKEAR
jgi:hypothetical protein